MASAASSNSYMSRVSIYARDTRIVDSINNAHRNPKFFTDYELNSKITATNNLAEALSGKTFNL